jgi:hypothetical protein
VSFSLQGLSSKVIVQEQAFTKRKLAPILYSI